MRILFMILFFCSQASRADDIWLPGQATKLPSEYTNQESGYFSIIEGMNKKIYIGSAKYGVSGYLLEYDPVKNNTKMVMDVMKVIDSQVTGFAAQSKLHTRNNVGMSGKIYVGSKQGYPEKGESRDSYLGGYVLTFDPKTGKNEHFGIAKAKHGIISVIPDESRGVAYVSTCSDDRPLEHSHFMILDLKTKKYTDLGDMEHLYAFIVLDHQGRAYHPKRGGTIARFDPATKMLHEVKVTIDGQPAPQSITKDNAILNWDTTSNGKKLYSVEMTTNEVYLFDLTQSGNTINGTKLGKLLPNAKATDCRAMCVGADGRVWMAVTEQARSGGPMCHLVSYTPGTKSPVDHGAVKIANPNFTTFTDSNGKAKPWHHTIRKEKDGTLTPWQPLGIAAASDGTVYVLTLAPFTLIQFEQFRKK